VDDQHAVGGGVNRQLALRPRWRCATRERQAGKPPRTGSGALEWIAAADVRVPAAAPPAMLEPGERWIDVDGR